MVIIMNIKFIMRQHTKIRKEMIVMFYSSINKNYNQRRRCFNKLKVQRLSKARHPCLILWGGNHNRWIENKVYRYTRSE